MTRAARNWFTAFAVVGAGAGVAAIGLLWLIVNHPLSLVQTIVGMP